MKSFRPISKKWYFNYEYAIKFFNQIFNIETRMFVNLKGLKNFHEIKARPQNNGHLCLHICDKLKYLTFILVSKKTTTPT